MVERKRSGSLANFKATLAPLLPFLAKELSLIFLADIMAISDMAKMPLNRINKRIIRISSMYTRGVVVFAKIMSFTDMTKITDGK